MIPEADEMGVKAACELFLDSLIYNAHGTAADALWTRVPLVTAPGALQPARVAASMLLHPARALSLLRAPCHHPSPCYCA